MKIRSLVSSLATLVADAFALSFAAAAAAMLLLRALSLAVCRLQFMGEVEYSLSQRSFHVTLLRGLSATELEEVCQRLHRTLSRAEALEAEKVGTRMAVRRESSARQSSRD